MSELGDVLELMHTSEHRWRSLRAEGREWRHQALHLEAFMRMVERRRPGSVSVFGGSSEEAEEPEEAESTWRLWMEGTHKVRAEFAVGHGEMVTAIVDGSTWWSWSPSTGALTNEGRENAETGLGPGTALVHPAMILPAIDLEIRDRTTKLDRSVYEVLATSSEDDEEGENSGLLHGIGSGAEEYALLVDAERGCCSGARLGSTADRSSSSRWTIWPSTRSCLPKHSCSRLRVARSSRPCRVPARFCSRSCLGRWESPFWCPSVRRTTQMST